MISAYTCKKTALPWQPSKWTTPPFTFFIFFSRRHFILALYLYMLIRAYLNFIINLTNITHNTAVFINNFIILKIQILYS
jgi:hypothetical protein